MFLSQFYPYVLLTVWKLTDDRIVAFDAFSILQSNRPTIIAAVKYRQLRKSISLNAHYIEDNSDRRPRRYKPDESAGKPNSLHQKRVDHYYRNKDEKFLDWREEWGVEYCYQKDSDKASTGIDNYFPSTIDEVTDEIVATISAVLNQQTTNLDPNMIQNTVHGDSTMGYRPVRHRTHDSGRIGIELDWSVHDSQQKNNVMNPDKTDYVSVRFASLLLAGKLSQMDTFEGNRSDSSHSTICIQKLRPIAIYFNTVQQSLAASRYLLQLKRLERFRQQRNERDEPYSSIYDRIYIRSLGRNHAIPDELTNFSDRISSTKKGQQLASGQIDPNGGLVLIVQPTNYNDEFHPAGPSFDVIESIQRLLAIASIEQLPVIMISPRFLKGQSLTISSGWDQSGYYQQSSLYAGLEPPKGPTPWILRDFTPPVFCYVANAYSIQQSQKKVNSNDFGRYSYYSHLSLCQSIFHKGHTWNLFAAIRNVNGTIKKGELSYKCIAKSKNSAGRPTQQLMQRIWNEYHQLLQMD